MADYKLIRGGVQRASDKAFIKESDSNRDWRKYQRWLDDGGVPDKMDPSPSPPEDYGKLLKQQIQDATTMPQLKSALLGIGANNKAKLSAEKA